jgi:hypothetical protein
MIRLEGFAGELQGKKSLIITGSQYKQPDFQDFLTGGVTDRALHLHGKKAFDTLSYHWVPWTCIMTIGSPTDWSLSLTYLTNSQKNSICYIDQSLAVPDLFLQKLPRNTTFIHFHDVAQPLPPSFAYYDYIFLPPGASDAIIANIQTHSHFKGFGDLKEIFRELSVSGLGLCWSRDDNSLYWYETGNKPQIDLNSKQIGSILISIGQTMI